MYRLVGHTIVPRHFSTPFGLPQVHLKPQATLPSHKRHSLYTSTRAIVFGSLTRPLNVTALRNTPFYPQLQPCYYYQPYLQHCTLPSVSSLPDAATAMVSSLSAIVFAKSSSLSFRAASATASFDSSSPTCRESMIIGVENYASHACRVISTPSAYRTRMVVIRPRLRYTFDEARASENNMVIFSPCLFETIALKYSNHTRVSYTLIFGVCTPTYHQRHSSYSCYIAVTDHAHLSLELGSLLLQSSNLVRLRLEGGTLLLRRLPFLPRSGVASLAGGAVGKGLCLWYDSHGSTRASAPWSKPEENRRNSQQHIPYTPERQATKQLAFPLIKSGITRKEQLTYRLSTAHETDTRGISTSRR